MGDAVFVFETSKENYIGADGGAPLTLVQGPPGTGKTYATAFALLARLQGAMAAQIPWRGLICAHTHNAVNVALKDVHQAQEKLRAVQSEKPEEFAEFFDARLLDVPLFRLQGTSTDFGEQDYLTPLWFAKKEAEKYDCEWVWPREALMGTNYCLAGAVPMGARKVWDADKKKAGRALFQRAHRGRSVADESAPRVSGGGRARPRFNVNCRRRSAPDAADNQTSVGNRIASSFRGPTGV